MTATLSRPTCGEAPRVYDVEGYGTIDRENAIFVLHCLETDIVDSLMIDDSAPIRFQIGAGTSVVKVTRIY